MQEVGPMVRWWMRAGTVFLIVGIAMSMIPEPAEAARDRDRDGLSNAFERRIGTDPRRPDSDDDRLTDAVELWIGSDPLDPDSDDDGMDDDEEMSRRCDPNDSDSDGDGRQDGEETDDGTDPSEPEAHESDLVGDLQELVCPTDQVDGSITVGGDTAPVVAKTRFEHGSSCEDMRERLAELGPFAVEVQVKSSRTGVVWAKRVRAAESDDEGDVDDHDDGDVDDGGHDGDGGDVDDGDHDDGDDGGVDDGDHDGDDDGNHDGDDDGDGSGVIDGLVESMTCPTDAEAGSMSIGGVEVILTGETVYRGEATCEGMASFVESMGEVEVAVAVETTDDGPVAIVVELIRNDDEGDGDGGDGDGEPNDEEHES